MQTNKIQQENLFPFNKKRNKFIFLFILTFIFYLVCNHGWLGNQDALSYDLFSENYVIANLTLDTLRPEQDTGFIEYYGPLQVEYHSEYLIDYYFSRLPERQTTYFHANAWHARIYTFIARNSGVSPSSVLRLLYAGNALLMALMLAALTMWACRQFGTHTSLFFALYLACFSPALTAYGRNLFWVGWTFLFPLTAMLYAAEKAAKMRRPTACLTLFLVSFFTLLIRFLCSFEFVSSIILCAAAPALYYVRIYKKSPLQAAVTIASPLAGGVAAFACSLAVYYGNLLRALGNSQQAWGILQGVVGKHTAPAEDSMLWGSLDGLSVHAADVVSMRLEQTAFFVFNIPVRYLDISLLFVFVGLLFFALNQKGYFQQEEANKLRTLLLTTMASLLAPISWMILATHHAYIHYAQCPVLWYLPYLLFGALFVLYFSKCILLSILRRGHPAAVPPTKP